MTDLPGAGLELIRVVDLETTGQSIANGGVVEVGWQDLARQDGVWRLHGPPHSRLINPGRGISPETSAIHHIVDEDVVSAPNWGATAPDVLRPAGLKLVALAAHRAAFEQRWCPLKLSRGVPWVCTYKSALRLWPEAPSFSNQGLRYWRRPADLDRALGLPAHRAGPDAYVTAHHLRDMLNAIDLATLIIWSAEPALLPRVPYGAHRGRAWRDLDTAVLEAIIRGESGSNPDAVFSAKQEMRRRAGTAATPPVQSALTF